MLQVDHLQAAYGRSQVLQGVSLQVAAGQLVVLLGRNGVGKTTLLKSIMGFVPPHHGRVQFANQPLQGQAPHQIARAGIGYVPQGRGIFPTLTVQQNLTLAARGAGADGWTLERTLDRFTALRHRLQHHGRALSGGEQQMLALGRALMTNPRLLLLDEPSEGLAPLIVQQMADLLRQLAADGLGILLVEQNIQLAVSLADWVYVMNKGQTLFAGSATDWQAQPDLQRQFLGV